GDRFSLHLGVDVYRLIKKHLSMQYEKTTGRQLKVGHSNRGSIDFQTIFNQRFVRYIMIRYFLDKKPVVQLYYFTLYQHNIQSKFPTSQLKLLLFKEKNNFI